MRTEPSHSNHPLSFDAEATADIAQDIAATNAIVGQRCVACFGMLAPFGKKSGYTYARCTVCGTVQLSPQPSRKELTKAYSDEYAVAGHYGSDPAASAREARPYHEAAAAILKCYNATQNVLDYGTGWGGMLECLRDNGIDGRGVELSHDMVRACQDRGLAVEQGDIGTVKSDSVSAMTMGHVFEHLVQHHTFLHEVHRALEDQGLLVTMQPTAHFGTFVRNGMALFGGREPELPELYKTFHPPWHTVLFSIEGMRILAKRSGFEVIEVQPAPQGQATGLTGVIQQVYGELNRVGWAIMGEDWPLCTGHTFVLRAKEMPEVRG